MGRFLRYRKPASLKAESTAREVSALASAEGERRG